MNKYKICDYENALECMSLNGYSKKATNVFYYAPDCYRQDMYEDFEENPELTEEEFMIRYKIIVYRHNFKYKSIYKSRDN